MPTLPLATVKATLSALIDQVEGTHERVVITRNGVPAAVMVSLSDIQSLEETVSILSDARSMAALTRGEREFADDDVMDAGELARLMQKRTSREVQGTGSD